MDLKTRALKMAMETFLSTMPEQENMEAVMEALQNNDQTVLDELDVIIWHPFDEMPLDELYLRIEREEDMIFHNLIAVMNEGLDG